MATQILNRIGSEEEFFTLSQAALSSRLEFSGRITDNTYRSELLDKARAEVAFIESNRVRCFYFTDENYPQRLLECDDAPVMLYALGNADINATHMVSIVGTRNATVYGVNFINRLIGESCRANRQPDNSKRACFRMRHHRPPASHGTGIADNRGGRPRA